ncbi:isopeptide-forming domain-containing fimbrial protein [Fusicatenibacter sp. CLA-AA-H213]|nr:isopeptide-forming domain-containing fimbrial protein [Fusicatenibacter sp. CLA-AA-H213]
MSKVKRILSVIMAMVMVLAMSVPTFAAGENATITLKSFDKANKVEYMQIIQKDETKTSGWAFTNGAGKCFTEAFGLTDSEDAQQQVIWGLIKYNDNSVKLPTGVTAVTATAAKIDLALSKVAALSGFTVATNKESIEVNAAGVYAIKAEETGFTYKTATAYVGFGEPYPALTNAEVTAKKSPTSVDKTVVDEEDHVVAIGDIVTYTIEAYVPFIDAANTENRTFTITDKITGADYYLTGAGSISSVTMVGTNNQVGTIEPNEEGTGFTINLNSLVTDTSNPNAGKKITVTYTAKVKELTVENRAGSHAADVEYGGNNVPVKLFTGEITLLKYGDSDVTNVLKDAEFEVSKDEAATPLKFKLQENGNYRYAPDAEDASTVVKTNAEGKIVVEGLNVGTYHFKETKAPEGYSINTDGKDITLTQTGVATAIVKASDKLNDTKLNALPSTGGIGTTIFTIGGCAIMIVAAGLFFATRRKTQK